MRELGTVIARILGDYGPRIRPGRVKYKLAFIEEEGGWREIGVKKIK